MRAFAVTAVALTALGAPALAGASHGGSGPNDFAVGGGTTGNKSAPTGEQHVDFAAALRPSAFDPVTGHFRAGGAFDPLGATAFQQEGPVTCLVVEDNKARLVYANKQATPTGNDQLEVLIFLEDNGGPVNGRPQDEIGFVLLNDETPDDDPPSEQDPECIAPTETPAMVTLEKGNFTIHDAE